jgi:hypothetical protein
VVRKKEKPPYACAILQALMSMVRRVGKILETRIVS